MQASLVQHECGWNKPQPLPQQKWHYYRLPCSSFCHAFIGCFAAPIPAGMAIPYQRLMQLHMHRCISHISGSKFLDATHAVHDSTATAASHGKCSDAHWSDIEKSHACMLSGLLLTCHLFGHGVDAALCLERSIGISKSLQAPQSQSVCLPCLRAPESCRLQLGKSQTCTCECHISSAAQLSYSASALLSILRSPVGQSMCQQRFSATESAF